MLSGYKTYILAGAMAVATFIKALGYIDEATYQNLLAFLGTLSVATVRMAISKISDPTSQK